MLVKLMFEPLQGIELKTAAANPYLGLAHLQSSGKFVEAQPGKLTSPNNRVSA